MKIVANDKALVLQLEVSGEMVSGLTVYSENLGDSKNVDIIPAVRNAIVEGKSVLVRLRPEAESDNNIVAMPCLGIGSIGGVTGLMCYSYLSTASDGALPALAVIV